MLQQIEVRSVKGYSSNTHQPIVSIIEVADEISESFEFCKILQQHMQCNKWVLLLAPDHVPSKHLLDSLAIDRKKLLVIRQKHLANISYVLNAALRNGNFSAVVSWTNLLDDTQLNNLLTHSAGINTPLYHFKKVACNTKQVKQFC